ncbi:MAG: adenylate kinase [Frankiales bacterium]|nr:adenylate kinase [Frankiales bacterium]
MRLLLIGAPGAGKGTQAERIAQRFGLVHISSGDLLREHVARGTELGQTASEYMNKGDLVPDELVLTMLREPVIAAAEAGGYVLDGFPRNVGQAMEAYDIAKPLGVAVQVAVYLEVARESLIDRIVERGKTSGRADDTREVVEHRIAVYEESTWPLLDYYREREQLLQVDGDLPVDEVTDSVLAQLERVRATL